MFHHSSAAAKRIASTVLRLSVVFAMVLTLVCSFANSAIANNIYTIQADSDTYTVEAPSLLPCDVSDRNEVTSLLKQAGVDVSSTDQIVPLESADSQQQPVELSVMRAQYATLEIDGALTSVLLQEGDTAETLIQRLNIQLGEFDIVSLNGEDISADLGVSVCGNDTVVINRVEITYYEKVKKSSFEKVMVADPKSYIGTERVKQAGKKGKTIKTYEKKIIDGGEPIVTLVKTKSVNSKPEIIEYGTKVSFSGPSALSQSNAYITNCDQRNGTITLSDGSTYGYSSKQEFTATAYTAQGNKRTSTGRTAQVGVVAVDPRVIPYGTRMYIYSGGINYGVCVAGDCGVKGRTIDLYFNSRSQCFSFGRRSCTVYFLK